MINSKLPSPGETWEIHIIMNHGKVGEWGMSVCGRGLEDMTISICTSHSEVPKGTTVQLPTTKKKVAIMYIIQRFV